MDDIIYLYTAENVDKDGFIKSVLLRHTAAPINILRTQNGKPYLEGNSVYFNLTHSGNFLAIAVSSSPVGVDMEVYGRGLRQRVISRFGEEEQNEIKTETDFLQHWTAREAYVKLCGDTLAHMLQLTAFTGGILTCENLPVQPQPRFIFTEKYVLSVCGEGEIKIIG